MSRYLMSHALISKGVCRQIAFLAMIDGEILLPHENPEISDLDTRTLDLFVSYLDSRGPTDLRTYTAIALIGFLDQRYLDGEFKGPAMAVAMVFFQILRRYFAWHT